MKACQRTAKARLEPQLSNSVTILILQSKAIGKHIHKSDQCFSLTHSEDTKTAPYCPLE